MYLSEHTLESKTLSGIPPVVYLYNSGAEYVDLTGGWIVQKGAVKNVDNINIANTNPLFQNGGVNGYRTTNTVNLTNYTKLKILYSSNIAVGPNFLTASTTTNFGETNVASLAVAIGTDVVSEIDVTSLNSSYYIGGYLTAASMNVTIKKIWLE
jgi:hypothetical protein